MRSVVRGVFRGVFYTATILLFALVAVAGFTQTKSFRNYLQNLVLASYPAAINGTLHVGSIEGNLVTGLQLTNVVLEDSITRVLSVDRIDLRYDVLGLIFQRASIGKLTLINPEIHIYRTSHGAWNVDGIPKSTPGDTTTSPWYIEAKQIELINARVTVIDSLGLLRRKSGKGGKPLPHQFDYSKISLERLNASVAMQIFQKRNFFQIKKLNFESTAPRLRVTQLIGEALLAPKELTLKKLRIETERSLLFVNASVHAGDFSKLGNTDSLKSIPISLDVNAIRLNTAELKQLIYPSADFLNGDLSARVTASGTLDSIVVEQVLLQTAETFLQVQGGVFHLFDKERFTVDLFCNNNRFSPDDLPEYVPGLHLPDVSSIGTTTFSIDLRGKPTDCNFHLKANALAGSVNVSAAIKQEGKQFSYDIDLATQRLNLGLVLNSAELVSSLSGKLKLKGTGVDLQSIIAVARVELDSSTFYKLPFQPSVIVVDAAQGILTSRLALRWRTTQFDAAAKLDTRIPSSVAYEASGRINSLDLQDLLRNKDWESDITGSFSAAGDVGTNDKVADTLELRLGRSSFGSTFFDEGLVRARYELVDSTRHRLEFISSPVQAKVEGEFTPASIISSLQFGLERSIRSISRRAESLDSIHPIGKKIIQRESGRAASTSLLDTVNYSLKMNWSNLSALGVLLHQPLGGSAQVDASVRGGPENLSIASELKGPELWLGSGLDSIHFKNIEASAFASKISRSSVLDSLELRVAARATELNTKSNRFSEPQVSFTFGADTGSLAASSVIDSVVKIDFVSALRYRLRLLEIDLSDIQAKVGPYTFASNERAFLTLGKDGIQITRLKLKHNLEEISASGFFSPGGISDVSVSAKGVLLNRYFIQSTPLANALSDIQGVLYANATLRGSFDHPNISLEASVDGLKYVRSGWSGQEQKVISYDRTLGRLDCRLSYFEHSLATYVRLVRSNEVNGGTPDVLVSGTLPLDLTLSKESPHALTGSMNLQLSANHFDLQLLAPFLPVVSNLQGTISCDMKMSGALEKPQYSGSVNIERATFVFDPVGIQYQLEGKLVPSGDRIQFQNMVIRNAGNTDRAMAISGTLGLLGLRLNDFDLRFDGSLEVMREDFRSPGGKFYGDLYVSSGSNGIHWKGTLDQSLASGDVVVNSARLTFPPEREAAGFTIRSIAVLYVDDTSKVAPSNGNSKLLQPKPPPNGARTNGGTPSVTQNAENKSFLDRIGYDLSIQVSEQTKVRFVFSTATSEELYAVLRGRLGFLKNQTSAKVSGELAVGEGSYYYLIKKFNASGSLQFTGDPLNPELNIVAQYAGTHQADTTNRSIATQPGLERVNVILTITETRNAPKTKIDLDVQSQSGQKIPRADAESDALSFIMTGKWKEELTQPQSDLLAIGSYGLAAGALTGPLSSVLRERTKGYVQSVDVAYYGSGSGTFGEKADVRLTGQVGDAVIRAGGKVLNDPNNMNVSVELPISSLLNNDRLRNFILTLERKVDDRGDITDQRRAASNGAKLFYRFTF